MSVKYKVTSDLIPEMKERLKSVGEKTVVIGALQGDHAWL